jgi:GT2 family glycosyltransferase
VKVSFIIPLFNCLPVTQAIAAGLPPSLPANLEYEIILVDDGSTDGTREWLGRLQPPFRAILNEGNLGYGAANNRGAAAASGDLLALLNNDLVLEPGWFEPMLAAHRALGKQAGLLGNVQIACATGEVDHAGIFINAKGKPEHLRRRPDPLARWLRPVRPVAAVTGACVLIGADLWRQLGGFDEGYRNGCEDIDLALRARALGRVNAVALRSVIRHHVSTSPGRKQRDEENTRRLARRWREELANLGQRAWTRREFLRLLPDPRDFANPLLAWHQAFYLLRLRSDPPPDALPGMRAAIAQELERWNSLLGPLPGDA